MTVSASSPEISTVYVTAPVSYVEVDLSEAPTSTLTRVSIRYGTTTTAQTSTEYLSAAQTSSAAGQADPGSPYDSTITQIAVVTITNVNLTPLPSGGSLTYTETAAANGLFNYFVENGTTCWLDGETPAPGGAYVYSTSSVTVVPVYDPTSSSEQATSTSTLQSTLYVTHQLTLTETLDSTSSSSNKLPYSKIQGGWNATKTSSGGVYSGATGSPTLVLYSTFNIYGTSHSTISKSTLAAASGFYAFSTPVSGYAKVSTTPSDPGSSTSSASGQETPASINGVTISLRRSSGFPGPYVNSTSVTLVQVTSVASGVPTSLTSRPSRTLLRYSSSCESKTSTDTCTEKPINSTFATSVRATSAMSGILTSSSSSASGAAVGSSSASVNSTSLYSGGLYSSSSTLANSTASSSALGDSTSSTSSMSASVSLNSSQPVYSSSSAFPTSSHIASTPSPQVSSSLASTSTVSAKTSTYVSSSASASPSGCGEYGDFILNVCHPFRLSCIPSNLS